MDASDEGFFGGGYRVVGGFVGVGWMDVVMGRCGDGRWS